MNSAKRGYYTGWMGCGLLSILMAGALATSASASEIHLNSDLVGPYSLAVVSWRELPFRRVVHQQYDFSCGSAALATLLRYQYGIALTEQTVFKTMFVVGDQPKIRKVGFSMLDMKRYLKSIGLVADGYKVSLDKIAQVGLPVIVVQQLGPYKHFVVIKGVRGSKVLVGDPASGARLYTREQFLKTWNGVAFVVDPGEKLSRAGVFDRTEDWDEFALPNYRMAIDAQQSIAGLTLNLPTVFQISLPAPALGGAQ